MSYRGTADVTGLPELESTRRLRESGLLPVRAGGPGSGPRKSSGGAKYPSGSKKPSQLDALRGDKPVKTLKDHVKHLADELNNGDMQGFGNMLKDAAKQAKSEGNSKASSAIQFLQKADRYMDVGSQRGSDQMMDHAEDMYSKGMKSLKKSL